MVGSGRRSNRHWKWIVLAACVLVGGLLAGHAVTQPVTEYEVKAAFLYNFTRFVEWPPDALARSDVFIIGILGRDPFGGALDAAVQGKNVLQKELAVRRFATAREASGSQILFISPSEEARLPLVLRELEGANTLTVGETDGFARRGGMIEFRIESNRVRFDINVVTAERAKLKLSSQLLKLARVVTGGPRGSE
jgi:hypothetical protein